MNIVSKHLTRPFWLSLGIAILFNGTFLVWLLLKPGPPNQLVAVNSIYQAAGYLLGALFCLNLPWSLIEKYPGKSAYSIFDVKVERSWVPLLLSIALIGNFVGQTIFIYYYFILHQIPPRPNLADAFFLLAYLFQAGGLLRLPISKHVLSNAARLRLALDAMMIMIVIMTFSWYFILGPTILQGDGTLFAKIISAAYLYMDLITICCVLLLSFRCGIPAFQQAVYLLLLGLTIIAVSDSITQYQLLNHTYIAGNLLNLGRPSGFTLVGLAIRAIRSITIQQRAGIGPEQPGDPSYRTNNPGITEWRILLPYVLVPIVMLLSFIVWNTGKVSPLSQGVYLGGAVLIGVILMRQILAIREAQQFNKAFHMANRRLEAMAKTDSLTNLGNHRAYLEDLHSELESAIRAGETRILTLITIDGLKRIHHLSRHMQDDYSLTTFTTILRDTRLTSHLYHLNGDEFAMILPHMIIADAITAMEQLRQDAEKSLPGTTVSIGMATTGSTSTNDIETLQEQAHAALSEARQRSHNTIVLFEDIRDSVSFISPAKVHALHRLLAKKQVSVSFQPIWDLNHNTVLSFEALTRLPPEYGFTGPQEAFDFAEKVGLAHELDYVCVNAILARAAELPPETLLFLNLSPQTLNHDVLSGSILLEAVLAAGFTPDRVVLEITERSAVKLDVIVREAKKLQDLGFRLALDDTGAGNAGLEMLSRVPVDFVKIDRAIVANALTDTASRAIFTGITTMSKQMNSYVIAEGIENKETLQLAQRVGVQGVQGYLLGRPNQAIPGTNELATLKPGGPESSSHDPLVTSHEQV